MNNAFWADILELSIPQRIQLAEEIWNSIPPKNQVLPLSQAQGEELDRRLKDYRQHPREGTSWETVKNRILG